MKKMTKSKWVLIAVGCVAGWLFGTGKHKNIVATVTNLLKGNSNSEGGEGEV